MDFLRDFFFTDISNHREFFKWSLELGRKDEVLLVGILERLAAINDTDDHRAIQPARIVQPGRVSIYAAPQATGIADATKNPFIVAEMYASMKKISGHGTFNMFELACLKRTKIADCTDLYMWWSLLVVVIQITLSALLLVYVIAERDDEEIMKPDDDLFIYILIIVVVSSILFCNEAHKSIKSALSFSSAMHVFHTDTKGVIKWDESVGFIVLELFINVVLTLYLCCFNVYYIGITENPTVALIHVITLSFIFKIDDTFKPEWSKYRLEDEKANVMFDYIFASTTGGGSDDLDVTVSGDGVYDKGTKFYIEMSPIVTKANISQFEVEVYASSPPAIHGVNVGPAGVNGGRGLGGHLNYNLTTYTISEGGADRLDALNQFHAILDGFHCIGILHQQRNKYA
jgi:hypothetical protein